MYKLYRKCKPTEENKYGMEAIENGNPFEHTTFLSLLAINKEPAHTNGSISRNLELAGLRTPNGEENISLESVPIDFIGLSYSDIGQDGLYEKRASRDSYKRIDEDTIIFVKTYILPLISVNGQRKDFLECCRNMRNINVMCYCDALLMVRSMSMILTEEMQKLGFTEDEIDTILSQVCIIPVGTEKISMVNCIKDIKFTTIFLADIIDTFEVSDEETKANIFGDYKEILYYTADAIGMEKSEVCKNSRVLIVNDDGNHDLSKFIHKGVAFPSIVVRLVNALLNNSVRNNNSNDFVSIDVVINEVLEKIIAYYDVKSKEFSKEELMTDTLQSISYPPNGEIDLDYLNDITLK